MSAAIGLVSPKCSANVASVLRTADCFGASAVFATGIRYRRHGADTSGAYSRVPLIQVDNLHAHIPFAYVPVAIEIVDGCDSLPAFAHPRNALYVFGPEDGSLGRAHLSWCRHVIRIPTRLCLNLGVCVAVVLYDRAAKIARGSTRDTDHEAVVRSAFAMAAGGVS